MGNLIKVELMKILHHKSIYIILFIMFLFVLLNNILYKNDYDFDGRYKYGDEDLVLDDVQKLKEELKRYTLEREEDQNIYITLKSKIDLATARDDYDKNSWQYVKYNDYLYDIVYKLNYSKLVAKNIEEEKFYQQEYDSILAKFKNDNWKYFMLKEKNRILLERKELVAISDNNKEVEISKKEKLKTIDLQLKIINYRLQNGISYENNYLNRAVLEYENSLNDDGLENLKGYKRELLKREKKEKIEINKYIIENKQNVMKVNSLNYQMRSVLDDYELFILVITFMLGSICLGEEITRGTIKLLLVKPYSRNEVLLAKFLSSLVMILLSIVLLVIFNILIGGFFLGIDTLINPVVVYDFNFFRVKEINVFLYMFLRICCKLPMILLLLVGSFILNLIFNGGIGAFAIMMIFYTFSEVINNFIIKYNIKLMQYFITINWNLSSYLYGGISQFEYIGLKKSITILIIYGIMLFVTVFVIFNKKNIRNT